MADGSDHLHSLCSQGWVLVAEHGEEDDLLVSQEHVSLHPLLQESQLIVPSATCKTAAEGSERCSAPPGHAEFAVASSGYLVGISAHHSLGTAVPHLQFGAEVASVSRGISGKSACGTIGKLTTSSDST